MDALSCLRQATIDGTNVEVKDDRIIFGEHSALLSAKTNIKQDDSSYYTIHAIWFFLKCKDDQFGRYLISARNAKIPTVPRTNKKTLLDYLTGKSDTCDILDASVTLPAADKHADIVNSSTKPETETKEEPQAILEELGVDKVEELRKKRKAKAGLPEDEPQRRSSKHKIAKIEDIINREVSYEDRNSLLRGPKKFTGVLEMLKSGSDKKKDGKDREVKQKKPVSATYDRYNQPARRAEGEEFGINEVGNIVSQTDSQKSSSSKKKKSYTPIIIVPSTTKDDSICMYNVKKFLEEGDFLPVSNFIKSGAPKPTKVAVRKKRESGSVPYKIVDNTNGMTKDDWSKVVACFITGPEWELKRWPAYLEGGPPNVFANMKGFYVCFEDQKLHDNINKWDVTVLKMSRIKPYVNQVNMRSFWEALDLFTFKRRAKDLRL
eukprot:m.81932 g.81932  ORF g.81932 m.81932 type:complete len:434 (-) comp12840_c1_seq2:584-1885(-)